MFFKNIFDNYFTLFLGGENITGTVVSSTNITITLSRPSYLYYLFNTSNDEIVAAEKVTNNIETWLVKLNRICVIDLVKVLNLKFANYIMIE